MFNATVEKECFKLLKLTQDVSNAMLIKLIIKVCEGYSGWDDLKECPDNKLEGLICEHLAKNWTAKNIIDIMNFFAFLWHRRKNQ